MFFFVQTMLCPGLIKVAKYWCWRRSKYFVEAIGFSLKLVQIWQHFFRKRAFEAGNISEWARVKHVTGMIWKEHFSVFQGSVYFIFTFLYQQVLLVDRVTWQEFFLQKLTLFRSHTQAFLATSCICHGVHLPSSYTMELRVCSLLWGLNNRSSPELLTNSL